jgi:hypothetical protein
MRFSGFFDNSMSMNLNVYTLSPASIRKAAVSFTGDVQLLTRISTQHPFCDVEHLDTNEGTGAEVSVEGTHPLYLKKNIGIGNFLYDLIHRRFPS